MAGGECLWVWGVKYVKVNWIHLSWLILMDVFLLVCRASSDGAILALASIGASGISDYTQYHTPRISAFCHVQFKLFWEILFYKGPPGGPNSGSIELAIETGFSSPSFIISSTNQ